MLDDKAFPDVTQKALHETAKIALGVAVTS